MARLQHTPHSARCPPQAPMGAHPLASRRGGLTPARTSPRAPPPPPATPPAPAAVVSAPPMLRRQQRPQQQSQRPQWSLLPHRRRCTALLRAAAHRSSPLLLSQHLKPQPRCIRKPPAPQADATSHSTGPLPSSQLRGPCAHTLTAALLATRRTLSHEPLQSVQDHQPLVKAPFPAPVSPQYPHHPTCLQHNSITGQGGIRLHAACPRPGHGGPAQSPCSPQRSRCPSP